MLKTHSVTGCAGAEQVPAAASQPEASPKPKSSLSLNSIGDGKAFVSEEEWRVIDKKVSKVG